MASQDQLETARFFAHARASASRRLTGDDLQDAEYKWWPSLGGKFVDCGFFKKREDAVKAAQEFRQNVRNWLARQSLGDSDG